MDLPHGTATLEVCEYTNVKVGYRTTGFVSNDSRKRFQDGQFLNTGVVDQYKPELKKLLTKNGTEYDLVFLPMAEWDKRIQSSPKIIEEWTAAAQEVPEPAQAVQQGFHQPPKDPNLQE